LCDFIFVSGWFNGISKILPFIYFFSFKVLHYQDIIFFPSCLALSPKMTVKTSWHSLMSIPKKLCWKGRH